MRFLANAIVAASCGGRCAWPFNSQILRSVRHGGLRDSAAPPRAAPRRFRSRPLGGGHPHIADKALAFYELNLDIGTVGDRAVIHAAEESHVLLDDREKIRAPASPRNRDAPRRKTPSPTRNNAAATC